MSAARQIEDALFYAAASIADAEQRLRFLDQACAGNPELRAAVEGMLTTQGEAESFFASERAGLALPSEAIRTTAPGNSTATKPEEDENCGARVGRYKLLQRIGEGGCGVVYMAEQEEPVRRRVALKIIKLGMDTKSVIARFDAERQALAMMDHPNIARVLDAGATETGRPYFVMELVRGYKITEYCDRNSLATPERLDLFIQVCNAIQHAHQKGVIHRDIKPSNILVTLHDGRPVPKVIDFGIAKAIQGKLTDKTLFTAYEQLIGTPAYMSPEQAEMSGLDVDTRSDIYSLGVLLYELLTGKTPFNQEELMKSGLNEMRRKLREDEPQRPSTIITTLHGTELRATAEHRHVEPPRLISLLKGDLDWIVMKALEKDRARRYETANGLAMDVRHYLNNEPVVARPPSRLYRFQKMARRNRVVVISSGAVAVALIVGLGAATWMYLREREARQQQVRLREQAERAERREADLRAQAEAKEQINQAAIYVSQSKFEEANEVLNQIKTLPTQPSYDGVMAYRRVGEWLALQQRWAEAASRFYPLMEIDKMHGWQVVTLDYQACGVLLAECGNRQRYEDFCKAAIDRFRSSSNGDMMGRILKTCLLFPPGESTLTDLAPMALVVDQYYSPIPKERFPAWPTIYLALWEYRRGNYAAVDEWCRCGVDRSTHLLSLNATMKIIQAMADHQRGRTQEAAQELAPVRQTVAGRFETGPLQGDQQGSWYDWVFARILLREATAMIEPEGPGIPGEAAMP
jgi:eukaryotic-like serine/threonine-protein kinase